MGIGIGSGDSDYASDYERATPEIMGDELIDLQRAFYRALFALEEAAAREFGSGSYVGLANVGLCVGGDLGFIEPWDDLAIYAKQSYASCQLHAHCDDSDTGSPELRRVLVEAETARLVYEHAFGVWFERQQIKIIDEALESEEDD